MIPVVASLLLLLAAAQAAPDSASDKVGASEIGRPAASPTEAGQISAPAASTDAGQISTAAGSPVDGGQITGRTRSLASEPQLSPTLQKVEAPPPLSSSDQSRNTATAAIHGHDHCDPAAGPSSNAPDCARILDNRADEFANTEPAGPAPVDTDKSQTGLVDDIVNGGTGTVVTLPPPPK